MTPISDMKAMSVLSRASLLKSSVIPRSQSDTTHNGLASLKPSRRGSDWSEMMTSLRDEEDEDVESEEETLVVLRPLQITTNDLSEADKSSLLYRRLSRGKVAPESIPSACSTSTSSRDVSRSQSMKFLRKNTITSEAKRRYRGSSIPSEVATNASKVQQRTISNRSLPLPGEDADYLRLRNFSITSKGVVNRGDSFRSKSRTPFDSSRLLEASKEIESPDFEGATQHGANSPVYKVLLIGAPDVGKTSIKNQFMTSEYICAYDGIRDEANSLTLVVDGEESQLDFEEPILDDKDPYNTIAGCQPDAYIVVYSVTSRRSYLQARRLLSLIESDIDQKAIIIVGNKTDLARLRAVSTEEGRALAKGKGCKFIETSVAINHQVDELLVGILTQIKMKQKLAEKQSIKKHKRKDSHARDRKSSIYTGSKASGILKRILQRACLKSKSCDNLHVL